jgi:hypothetical protein
MCRIRVFDDDKVFNRKWRLHRLCKGQDCFTFHTKNGETCSYMNNIQDDSYIKEIYLDLALEKSMLVADAHNENATLPHGSESDEEARR